MSIDRRGFLSSLGALGVAGLVPSSACAPVSPRVTTGPSVPRGLAPADDFLFEPGLVYTQTGSLGPCPRQVLDRTLAAWTQLERNPTAQGYGGFESAMDDVRARAAAFIGCTTDELVLTRSTTDGMNAVVQGLTLVPGDRIIVTDQEHPGGRLCWDFVARRQGAIIEQVVIPVGENDPRAIVERFAKLVTPRTRVMSFSHVLSSTGLRMPVAELSALARQAGCLSIVDGAQAVGGIAVDVKALGCHVYATSGHKWLLGPKGTGLLYLSAELGSRLDLIALAKGHSAYTEATGICSIPSVIGLGAAIDYQNAIGKARIESYDLALARYVHEVLAHVPEVKVVSAAPGSPLASPLVTFVLPPAVDGGTLGLRLQNSHHVAVKVVPANWLNGNRISTHLFNTEREIDALVTALATELARA